METRKTEVKGFNAKIKLVHGENNIPFDNSDRDVLRHISNDQSSPLDNKISNYPIGSLIPRFDQSQSSNVNSVHDSRLNSSRSNDNPLV